MDEARVRIHRLRDPDIPAMPVLLGDDAAEPLAAALGVSSFSMADVQATSVSWHPGRSLAIRYQVTVDRVGLGSQSTHSLVAWAGPNLPRNATVVEGGHTRVAVWELPNDPALPGLALALNPAGVRALLDNIGAPPGDLHLTLRAYRPARRAVVEVSAPSFTTYIKVVQPDSVRALQARHRIASPLLAVPRSHGWSEELGLVVLEALPGITLGMALDNPSAELMAPNELAALLERIPDPRDGSHTVPVFQAARSYSRLIARLLPDLKPRLKTLGEQFQHEGPAQELVPVHGDFHEGQLLLAGGHVSGLLDVDTVAMGHRIDDWATLLAHLCARQLVASQPTRVAAFGRELLAFAERQMDANELRRRIAAVLIGLATGPFRVQLPRWPEETRRRIALAERWLETSKPSRERILTNHSGVSHARRGTLTTASRT